MIPRVTVLLLLVLSCPAWGQSVLGHDRPPTHKPVVHRRTPVVRAKRDAHPHRPVATAATKPAPAVAVPPVPPPAPAVKADPTKGTTTGLPLPRFVSLRTDEVNFRAGPGTQYPIEWVYERRGLPVEIEREFEVWRLVRDPDGIKGWVHQATLVGERGFIVTGAQHTMRDEASASAAPVAILKPGVVGRIKSCAAKADWCAVRVGKYRGFLQRDAFWGAAPDEAIGG